MYDSFQNNTTITGKKTITMAIVSDIRNDQRQPTNTAHYNVLQRLDKHLIEPKLVLIGAR
jgi:hypothetical protein